MFYLFCTCIYFYFFFFFFSSRRRHTRFDCDWSSDVCSSDLEGQRVRFQWKQPSVRPFDLELVELAAVEVGQEQLPHAGLDALAHRVSAAVPIVEVADHADPPGIRRPHREADAFDAIHLDQLRAEALVDLEMRSLRQQMHVDIAQDRRKAVWIVELDRPGRQRETQPVVDPARNSACEETLLELLLQLGDDSAGVVQHPGLAGRRMVAAHYKLIGLVRMQAEQRE